MGSYLLSWYFSGIQINQNRDIKQVEKVKVPRDYLKEVIVGLIGILDEAEMKKTGKSLLCNLSNQRNDSFSKDTKGVEKR